MTDEAIMENYGNIQDILSKIQMLDARVLKLEEIIVELCNVEPEEGHFTMEDMAEIALENRANEDRGEDR